MFILILSFNHSLSPPPVFTLFVFAHLSVFVFPNLTFLSSHFPLLLLSLSFVLYFSVSTLNLSLSPSVYEILFFTTCFSVFLLISVTMSMDISLFSHFYICVSLLLCSLFPLCTHCPLTSYHSLYPSLSLLISFVDPPEICGQYCTNNQ